MFIWTFAVPAVLNELLNWLYAQIVGFLGNFFEQMGGMGVELLTLPWVQGITSFFSRLGWALFGVSLVVSVFESALEYNSGRGNLRQTAVNWIKGFFAVSLFTIVPVRLYTLSISLQGTVCQALTDYGTIGEAATAAISQLSAIDNLAELGESQFMSSNLLNNPLMVVFCVIMMAYAVIKVFFANLKRGGILLIQISVGSLYMFSITRGYGDGFIQWMKQVIGLCLTAFLQATILTAGLMVFRDHILLGLGLMLSAGEVPRVAGAFGLDTTTRASIMSAVYTAQAAVNTTRTIATAVVK